MNPLHTSPSSALPLDVGGIVQWSPWGLVVAALLGLGGCVPASRGWVQAQLAPVQTQVAEVRDRVAVVEQHFGRLDPKVDRILAEMEQQSQQSLVSSQPPTDTRVTFSLPSPSQIPGNLPAETSLDLTITGGATPLGGGTIPPGKLTVEMPAETRQRREPRQLTEDQREQLLRTLREDPKVPLAVVSISGDNESYAFAQRLNMLFDIAGWPTRGISQQTVSGVSPGLTFVTKSGNATVLARAARLQDTLHAMGIAAQSRALESMPQGLLMLVVGPKPQ
jgi:hypothetical protein